MSTLSKRSAQCAKAGKARQARLDVVREFARRLAREHPDAASMTLTELAKAIAPEVARYARSRRLPVGLGELFYRTVKRWIDWPRL